MQRYSSREGTNQRDFGHPRIRVEEVHSVEEFHWRGVEESQRRHWPYLQSKRSIS